MATVPGATTLTPKAGSGVSFGHAEVVGDMAPGDAFFGNDGGRVTMIRQVDYLDEKFPLDFIQKLQGFLGTTVKTGKTLQRKLPMRHPIYTHMFVERVAGVKLLGPTGTSTVTPRGTVANYYRADVTLSFAARPYALATDDQLAKLTGTGKERYRWCERKWKPITRIISSDREDYQFYNLPAGDYKASIKQGIIRSQCEGSLIIVWHEVPASYLFGGNSPDLFVAPKIQACVNKVNSAEIFGAAIGTLLLEQPEFRPLQSPIPVEPVFAIDGEFPPMSYDVILPMKYFEGATSVSTALAGHNTRFQPDIGDFYPIASKQSIKDGAPEPLYDGTDFKQMFEAA